MSTESDSPSALPSAQRSPGTARRSWVWTVAFSLMAATCVGLWGGGNWLVWKRVGRQAYPTTTGELQIRGLQGSVQVERDARGIPHVAASDESDAWTTLGFVHAQDRLSQMLWLRRMARGRTAEVAGERGLAADRLARTLGIGRLADAEASRVTPAVRSLLDAYAAGVNARMERIRQRSVGPPRGLSPQDSVLEAWTAGDSIAISKLLAWAASPEPETQLVLEALLERLGSVGARPFFPTGAGVQGISLPFAMPESGTPGREPPAAEVLPRPVSLSSVAMQASAWALLPEATAGGAPVLAVDFHLAPTAPALLYEAYLQGGELDLAGVTVPGLPVFWAGRNADVAWAASPARVVTADLYREQVRPAVAGESGAGFYRKGRRWHPLEIREERIRVIRANGSTRDVRLSVLSTRHGPLLDSDALEGSAPGERDPLAIRWTGFEAGNGLAGLHGVARAKNAAELRAALQLHHEPVISVLYADKAGEVAVQTAGWLPRKMLPTGVLPVTGHRRGFDWQAALSFEALPVATPQVGGATERKGRGRASKPARHLTLADGPNAQVFGAGGIEWLWRPGVDAAQLERSLSKLTARGPVELWQAAAMQRDLRSEVSAELLQAIGRLAGDPKTLGSEAREVAEILEGWDGQLRPNSRGATVYTVFLDHFLKSLFAQPVGPRLLQRYLELEHVRPDAISRAVILAAAGRNRPGGWSERGRVADAVKESLQKVSRTLGFRFGPDRERWIWAERHPIVFETMAASAPVASRTVPLSKLTFDEAQPLSFSSLNSGFVRFEQGELFRIRTVTTSRLLMDLSDGSLLLSVLAPGQSEHPGHPHFADGIPGWQAGEHRRVAMSPFLVGEATVERMVLRPRR